MINMIADNYGNQVDGDDLEVLPDNLDFLLDIDIEAVVKSDWWEVHVHLGNHRTMVALCALTSELIRNGAEFETNAVKQYGTAFVANKIVTPLKRWSLEDGFYHA